MDYILKCKHCNDEFIVQVLLIREMLCISLIKIVVLQIEKQRFSI